MENNMDSEMRLGHETGVGILCFLTNALVEQQNVTIETTFRFCCSVICGVVFHMDFFASWVHAEHEQHAPRELSIEHNVHHQNVKTHNSWTNSWP